MTRYRHYLHPLARFAYPQTILCVDCVGAVDVVTQTRAKQTEELVSWYTVQLLRKESKYGVVSTGCGSGKAAFWASLRTVLERFAGCWIVSTCCVRQWSLLGLWEELEDERWTICGTDNRNADARDSAVRRMRLASDDPLRQPSASYVSDMLGASNGYLCIEDTPNIARIRPTDMPQWCLWVDVRNYGVDVPTTVASGTDRARWCAAFMQRYTSALYSYNLGSLRPTAGAQAMGGFRSGYLGHAIYAHTDRNALECERRSIVGGRCECFRVGVIAPALYHADFRSAYGAVQRDCAVPVRLVGRVANPGPAEAEQYCARYGAIATVDIETDEPAYPYRRESLRDVGHSESSGGDAYPKQGTDTDIIYPIGRFTTTLAGPELMDALERGRIKRWHELCYYDMEHALAEYANAIYKMRCDAEGSGDSDIASVAKRLLVSLPGKFGQRDRRWVYCPEMHTEIGYGEWWGTSQRGEPCRYRSVARKVFRDEILGWSADSVPSVAAWITSAARIKLLHAIRIATWEHTYYVDTDSVMVDESGWTNLISSGLVKDKTLGMLYLKSGAMPTTIHGIKHYVEDGRLTCAGLPRGQCEDYGDGAHYWYTLSATEQTRNMERPEATRILRRYERGGRYRHRVVGEDGRTKPIVLSER